MEAEKLARELMEEEAAEEDKKRKAAQKKKSKKDKSAQQGKPSGTRRQGERRRHAWPARKKSASVRKRRSASERKKRRSGKKRSGAREKLRRRLLARFAKLSSRSSASLRRSALKKPARKRKRQRRLAERRKLESQKPSNQAQTFPGKVTKVFGGSHGYCFVNYKVYCARSVVEKTMTWPPKDGDSLIVKAIRDPARNNWKAIEVMPAKGNDTPAATNPPKARANSASARSRTSSASVSPNMKPVEISANLGSQSIGRPAAAATETGTPGTGAISFPASVSVAASTPAASVHVPTPAPVSIQVAPQSQTQASVQVPVQMQAAEVPAPIQPQATSIQPPMKVSMQAQMPPIAPPIQAPVVAQQVAAPIQPPLPPQQQQQPATSFLGGVDYAPFRSSQPFGGALGGSTAPLSFDRPPQTRMTSAPATIGVGGHGSLSGAPVPDRFSARISAPSNNGGYMGPLGGLGGPVASSMPHRSSSSSSGFMPAGGIAQDTASSAASSSSSSKRLSVFASLRNETAAPRGSGSAPGLDQGSSMGDLGGGMDFFQTLDSPRGQEALRQASLAAEVLRDPGSLRRRGHRTPPLEMHHLLLRDLGGPKTHQHLFAESSSSSSTHSLLTAVPPRCGGASDLEVTYGAPRRYPKYLYYLFNYED